MLIRPTKNVEAADVKYGHSRVLVPIVIAFDFM